MPKRFIIADDHALFRTGLCLLLGDSFGPAEILECAGLPELNAILADSPVADLVVVDLAMPGMAGAASIRALHHAHPDLRFVVVSGSEARSDVLGALAAGAFGYIPKSLDPDVMTGAFRQIIDGGIYAPKILLSEPAGPAEPTAPVVPAGAVALLTRRQRDVLQLLGKGQANKEIARVLDISEGTVKIHLAAIFRLLDARNRTEAVLKAHAVDFQQRFSAPAN